MPRTQNDQISRRGLHWRTVRLPDGRRARMAITHRPGGGRVVLVKPLTPKPADGRTV